MWKRLALTCALSLLPWRASAGPAAIVESEDLPVVRITGDQTLTQSLACQRLEIAPGATLRVTDDLLLEAETDLVVLGTIVAVREPASLNRDGVDLHLRAGRRIELRGSVVLSDGLSGVEPGVPGGRGGTLILDAPVTFGANDLSAGDGGDAGPGARGGDGGSIWLRRGRLFAFETLAPMAAYAGRGGHGGDGTLGRPDGGDGGDGGNAWAGEGPDSLRGEQGYIDEPPNGWEGRNGLPCEDGGIGNSGYAAFGGIGGNGGHGWHSTIPGASGGDGGRGGVGGHATGGDGGPGGKGGSCVGCSVAGKGGKGAYGSSATAGWGGQGGHAGHGLGAGANGGEGGNGGNGGTASAGDAGKGGKGGDCCILDDGIGGDGGPGGDANLALCYPGGGGPAGRGGNAGTFADSGGDGGVGGSGLYGYIANSGSGGDGGLGDIQAGAGGEGSDLPGYSYLPLLPFPGGIAGWPDGDHGADGEQADVSGGFLGVDGNPGRLCSEPAVVEPPEEDEYNHDETWENAYGWEFNEVQPPTYGAFAERFQAPGRIDAIHLHLSQLDGTVTTRADLYLWADDAGGVPGTVLAVFPDREVGAVATWPAVSAHRLAIDHFFDPGSEPFGWPFVWAGVWGNWPGQPIDWFLAADRNGPGGGTPHTNVAPGLPQPQGWQPVGAVFPSTSAMGIGLEVTGLGACCVPTELACCLYTSQAECIEEHSGLYLGDGTNCTTSPCGAARPSHVTIDTDCFELTLTDRGRLGFLDDTHAAGSGWRVPAGGTNHLAVGSLWVGIGPDSVLHRDYDLDPTPRWQTTSCPAGQVYWETNLPHVQVARSSVDLSQQAGGGPTHFRQDLRLRASDTLEGCGYALLEVTGQRPRTDGELVTAHYGLFLDVDVNGTSEDDHGAVIEGENLIYLTDPSGTFLGAKLLQSPAPGQGDPKLTFIPNNLFVLPNGHLSEEDKWAFLSPLGLSLSGDFPDSYSMLLGRSLTFMGSATPESPARADFPVALLVGNSLEELILRGQQAQFAYDALTADIATELAAAPFELACAPNPFSTTTDLRLTLPRAETARIAIHDVSGRLVRSLFHGDLPAGTHAFTWDGRGDRGPLVSHGIYFARVRAGDRSDSRTLLRLPR